MKAPNFDLRDFLTIDRIVPLTMGLLTAVAPLGIASAQPKTAGSFTRTTVVPMDRYHHEARIVRERSVGKDHVRFSADAQPIERSAVVQFEIRSESDDRAVVRWQCTARENVSECFAQPVKVRYLPEDERVVLAVRVEPARGPASGPLAAQ